MSRAEKRAIANFRKSMKKNWFTPRNPVSLTAQEIDIIFEKNGIKTGVNLKGRCQNE